MIQQAYISKLEEYISNGEQFIALIPIEKKELFGSPIPNYENFRDTF